MKAIVWGLMTALCAQTAYAQKSPIKYGDIPLQDLKMTVYDKDSSAAAVILADYGEAYITVGITASLNFERHVRIKILRKDGLRWADAGVLLYHDGSDEERLNRLKATTYNFENGRVVESVMNKDGVFKEKYDRNFNIQKFTLPNVKEGSVIEYSYTVTSDFLANFPNWQFQYTIPVRHSEYWAMFPEVFHFEKYMQGYITPTVYEVKNRPNANFQVEAHHWISKDVPAFREEPFMTSDQDYVSKINLALSHISFPGQPVREIMGTWAKLNDNLLESEAFGKVITGSGFLKKKAEELTAGQTDPLQKTTTIFNYVRQTLEWDGTKDYMADPLKGVFENKKGTSGDINLALASMLEKVDVPVEMILLSTRDHGFIRQQYPMRRQFNYVICSVKLGDRTMLLDATDRFLPMGAIPERCLNGQGLMISKTNHGWVNIEPKFKARTVVNSDVTLGSDGVLKGKLNYAYDGYDAQKMRRGYFTKGEAEYLKDFMSGRTWEVEKSEFKNVKEIDQGVKQEHQLSINEYATVAGDAIYFNPLIAEQIKENVFKLEKREYPVDFGRPEEKMVMCRITIPEGYAVEELPKPRVLLMPNNTAKYTYTVSQVGNTLNVVSILQINKSMFVQTEYADLREFYNQLVAKHSEQIVLKKKN